MKTLTGQVKMEILLVRKKSHLPRLFCWIGTMPYIYVDLLNWFVNHLTYFLLSTALPTKRFESDFWSANCGYFLQRMQKLILLSKVSLYRNHGKSINHVCWNSRFRFFSYCLSFSACDFRFSGLSLFGAVATDSFLGVFTWQTCPSFEKSIIQFPVNRR